MRLRWLFQISLIAVLLVIGVPLSHVAAQTAPDLTAKISSKNPAQSSVTLTNSASHACQVATSAQGTVAVTKVIQNGKVLQPQAPQDSFDDDLGELLQTQLKTLKPGESVTISLPVYKLQSGPILRATTWASGAGSFSTQYTIQANQPLQLELNYMLPITPAKGAPACGAVLASNIGKQSKMMGIAIVVGAGLCIVLLAVLVLLFWRKKRGSKHGKAAPTAMAIIFLALCISGSFTSHAYADIVVPPALQSTFDGCMAIFNANRDITGPVLDAINNPANHIEIVSTGRGSETTGYRIPGGGSFTIYWNSTDRHRYEGTGGYADPCTTLYHEMYHALDMSNGTFSRDDCAGSGIETKEVMATRAQNLLRVRLGMPPRSHYGRPLPTGPCTPPAPRAGCTGAHCASTTGDPHITTFDGLRYDFQAAGEFTVAQSVSGEYEIQARQEPWPGSRLVSVNTALAFKIGKDTVELQAGQAIQLHVNGKRQTLASTTLPGGGKLEVDSGLVILTWADGSTAYVRAIGNYGLELTAQAADQLSGKLTGLLGNADNDEQNDLHARGSTKAMQPSFKQLYPSFADSWRITDKTSLFTYDKDKNTASYTDRNFPDNPEAAKSLPGYAAAQAYCKSLGITDPTILANCALDLSITGRPEFAQAAVHNQSFTAGANFNGTTWQLTIKNPGDSASVTFDATANEKVYIAVKSTLPSQCGALRLLGPDNHEVTNGCIINGKGSIDGTVLLAAGTYTVALAPGGPTGTASLQLLRITDKQASITLDGPTVTAKIDQPGVVSRYIFAGVAGQRVYVDIPKSTLPSQCGIVRLLGPDGHEINNGCIVSGKGNIETAILPETGQYAIVLDPTDDATGQATLHAILATADSKPITLDGPTLSANITKPGSTTSFTFTATAGQSVYVDILNSELPSQCGILLLYGPDGAGVASGCIINKKGSVADAAITLRASGQYTITLNPNDSTTGKSTIRLRSH